MKPFSFTATWIAVLLVAFPLTGWGQEEETPVADTTPIASFTTDTVSQSSAVTIADQLVEYEVVSGTMIQAEDKGIPKARLSFTYYSRPGSELGKRPVTFAFNGGPGSSSVWLHLGMLGPKRILFPEDASLLKPPYQLSENPHSILDITDLVLIDPVSTGFSRPIDDQDKSKFHGYSEDVRSVGQFIHDWLSHFGRWESPKFLIGESYGGLRAAGLANYLQSRYRIELNGIVVVSGAINFQTLRFNIGNDLPYICFLPTYTATAWYHGQLNENLQAMPIHQVVAQAEAFALGEYASTLLRGDSAKPNMVQRCLKRMSELTGLSEYYLEKSRLRVSMPRFGKELLREDERTVGRFDSRYTGIDRDLAGSDTEYDPSGAAIFGPFTATMNHYLRKELGIDQPRPYEILTGNVQPWNYEQFTGRYVDASEELRAAMSANPHLKLFVACGYYDLATPHFAMKYTLNHLALDPSLRENITLENYPGGHMMYIYEPSMVKLRKDLVSWFSSAMEP
jgi:carboxypeptidase C (cathepsin A)